MPDCNFTIDAPSTAVQGAVISFRVDPSLAHPCGAIFSFGEKPLGGEENTGAFQVVQMAAGSMAVRVEASSGEFTISVTVECPGACGPTTKTHTVRILSERGISFWEVFKTVGLVVTIPLFLLYYLLYLISLGQLEKARAWARRVYRDGFPKWLRDLLG